MPEESSPVFRFAPSPNGWLHLGHALSAMLNADMAERAGGRFILRIEDIDLARARDDHVDGIFEDLRWLGLCWEEPVRRQSRHMRDYAAALARLQALGLVYPCFCSRGDISRAVAEREQADGAPWPRDPDGAPLYPGTCRALDEDARASRLASGEQPAWRLATDRALARAGADIDWVEQDETGAETRISADPGAWGDVVVARRDVATSYHLAVVVDDAMQGVTHVVRGRDLYHATSVQRLLQIVLGLPRPIYTHHRLMLDASGAKLSKSRSSQALRELRADGATPGDIRALVGL